MSRIYEAVRRAASARAVQELTETPAAAAQWAFSTTVAAPVIQSPPDTDRAVLASTAPAASEEAVQLALQLRSVETASAGRIVMFVPASPGVDASMAVTDAVCGLIDLHEGPLLVLDLRAAGHGAVIPDWLPVLSDEDEQMDGAWSAGSSRNAVVSRPFTSQSGRLTYAASPEFAARLADARARYACVLVIGTDVSAATETLMIAPLVDAVVLTIAPGRTTRPQMQRLTNLLRRARAHVIGFVIEARSAKHRGVNR